MILGPQDPDHNLDGQPEKMNGTVMTYQTRIAIVEQIRSQLLEKGSIPEDFYILRSREHGLPLLDGIFCDPPTFSPSFAAMPSRGSLNSRYLLKPFEKILLGYDGC